MSKFKALLLDIEGTICPISFVKDTLFPYAKTAISSKISTLGSSFPLTHKPLTSSSSSTKDSENPLLDHLSAFPQEYLSSPQSLLTHILSLIDNDIKDPALKSLQGYLWKDGYVSGIIKAPLYKDAIETIIKASKELQKGVSIYSSGSVAAQKLLLKYTTTIEDTSTTSTTSTTITDSQDLTLLINQYFDTVNAGPKIDPASYDLIASSLGLASSSDDKKSILFLSDNPKEVEAAIKAGLTSYIVIRPGNAPLDDETLKTYKAINTFENLL